ncbi:MAG: GAF domain-containing protein [Thermodesulfobacteriota bacterium]
MEEKAEKLSLLSHFGQILNSTLDPIEVRKRAIEAATKLMRAEAGSLLLVDEEERHLFFEVALGDKGESVKKILLEIGKGIAGWVAQTGQSLVVNDTERDPRFFKEIDERVGFKTKNILCVPVRVKNRILGVLEAINKKDGESFNEEDLSLFVSLVDQMAIALDNARLYEELEEMFYKQQNPWLMQLRKGIPIQGDIPRGSLDIVWL